MFLLSQVASAASPENLIFGSDLRVVLGLIQDQTGLIFSANVFREICNIVQFIEQFLKLLVSIFQQDEFAQSKGATTPHLRSISLPHAEENAFNNEKK